jgi:hypothetical protein
VDDDTLGLMLEATLQEVHRPYERLLPDNLPKGGYPGRYWIALETGDNVERMKGIARQVCDKWGKRSHLGPWLDNIHFVYFLGCPLNDDIVQGLWGIAGWEASSIVANDQALARRIVIQDFVFDENIRRKYRY